MMNEWSDRVDDDPPRSRWRIALDWAIGAVVLASGISFLVQIVMSIF